MSSAIPSTVSDAAHPAPKPRSSLLLVVLVTIPVIALDQLSKLYVSRHMALYESISIIPNWLDITYTRNVGAAFSMFTDFPPWFRASFLKTLSAAAIVVLLIMLAQAEGISTISFGFALILAGASGNLIDRAIRGEVIDFVRVHYHSLNYPVFNAADSAITVGVVLVLLSAFFRTEDSD